MDLLELQQRANVLVDKVNQYEESLTGLELDEEQIINEHKYVDIFCLRPVLKLLFGKDVSEKLSRTTVNDNPLRLYLSSAPANNQYTTFFKEPSGYINVPFEQPIVTTDGTPGGTSFVACSFNGRVIGIGNAYNATNPTEGRFDFEPFNSSGFLVYYYPEAQIATSFEISSLNAADVDYGLVPKKANLYGSNDIENWQDKTKYTLLQSYDFKNELKNNDTHTYQINNTNSYKIYALEVTDTDYYKDRVMIGYFKINCYAKQPIDKYDWYIDGTEHPFVQNIDMWNNYNMTQLDIQQLKEMTRQEAIEQGIGLSYSSNIKDALVTESQVANLFNWNTTSDVVTKNNTYTFNRQVPGLVLYYLGNGYDGIYTATIPYNPVSANINYVNFNTPPLYGAYYDRTDNAKSQVGLEMGAECCRIFLPGCNFFGGRLLSPQQIWQPDRRVGEANANLGYNYQGKALYHELVFKQRRTGCQNADVDFTEALSTVPDNDPQGLATRLTLSHQKDYYFNRPWFTELNSYTTNPDSSSSLASNIISNSNVEYTEIGDLADFITTNGSLSIDDGIVSNFSTQNYASITNNSTYKNNNIYIFDFTTGSNVSSTQNIFHSEYFLSLEVSNNQLRSYSWSGKKSNTLISIEPNKHYKIKVVVSNSNTKTFYRINDDNTETQLLVMTDSGMSFNNTDYSSLIGLSSYNQDSPFLGTMDFKNCSVQLNGSDTPQTFIEVIKKTRPMTDDEFYNSYKLDYNTFADVLNLPK